MLLKRLSKNIMMILQKKKNLHFFLGTTLKWHQKRARNPFIIVGTYHPPHQNESFLF